MNLRGILYKKNVIWLVLIWLLSATFLTGAAIAIWRAAVPGVAGKTALQVLQALQSLTIFILPALLVAWLAQPKPMEWLGFRPSRSPWLYPAAILIFLLAQPGINLLSSWNAELHLPESMADIEANFRQMEDAAQELTELFATATTLPEMLFNLLLMALLPAVAEELCFRGILQQLLSRYGRHIAVWTAAIIFSLVHFQMFGFLPRMLLGAALGYLFAWSGSLYVSITAHFTNNAMAVICYYLIGIHAVDSDALEAFGIGSTAWVGYLSIGLTVAGLVLIGRLHGFAASRLHGSAED